VFDPSPSKRLFWIGSFRRPQGHMMRFNLSGLLQEPIGETRTYEVDSTFEVEGHGFERVTGRVQFLRTRAGLLVRAHLGLIEPETCSRCLKPLDQQVLIDFEEEFQSLVDPRTGQVLATDERDPDAFVIDEKHTLDLSEALRQYREVSLLMQPLCRADCRGLCPRCGSDLNESQCGCEAPAVDDRWAQLGTLKSAFAGKD